MASVHTFLHYVAPHLSALGTQLSVRAIKTVLATIPTVHVCWLA